MKNISRFMSILLCLLLVASIISCGNIKDPLAENPELMDNVENNWAPLMSEKEATATMGLKGRLAYYEGCIYYKSYYNQSGSQRNTLYRYDMNQGTVSSACRDSACAHSDEFCPFFFGNATIIKFQIVNDCLYYLTASKRAGHIDTSKKGAVHCYNLKTLRYKKLFEFDVNNNSTFFCTDAYIYYTQCDFHEDDNGYDQSVWSYDLDSGKKGKLFVYGDENDSPLSGRFPLAIDEQGGFMIFQNLPADYEIFNFDSPQTIVFERAQLKKGAKIETVAEIEANFSAFSQSSLYIFDGKILFQELVDLTYVSLKGIQIERGLYDFSVRYVDVQTGEFGTLLEHTTLGYDIAGDYLYIRPFMPEIIDLENGTQDVYLTGGKFIQFNMKTGERKEYSLGLGDDIEFYNDYNLNYVRGRLFGYLQNHATGEVYLPIEYDIATGEMREVPRPVVNPDFMGMDD